ncbi:MAG: hypothetical protein C0459_08685 [Chitinophaga sp.]|nr:hypothetical protein [Chitinophaga sp.]
MRKEAIQEFRKYLNCGTAEYASDAYLNIGVCYFALHMTDSSAKNFDRAFDVSKNKSTTMKRYADYFIALHRYDTLLNICRHFIELDSNNSDAYFYAARSIWLARLEIMKRNKIEDYAEDTAIKSHLKDEIFYYYGKAIGIDSAKNYQKYKTRSEEEAANDMESNFDYYSSRGIFRENFIDAVGALQDFEMSILVHPTIFAFEHAAYMAKYLGQKEKACKYIQTWAHQIPYPPTNDLTSNVFEKVEIAKKFCKECGIKIKE